VRVPDKGSLSIGADRLTVRAKSAVPRLKTWWHAPRAAVAVSRTHPAFALACWCYDCLMTSIARRRGLSGRQNARLDSGAPPVAQMESFAVPGCLHKNKTMEVLRSPTLFAASSGPGNFRLDTPKQRCTNPQPSAGHQEGSDLIKRHPLVVTLG
jgi:hypothetical protein